MGGVFLAAEDEEGHEKEKHEKDPEGGAKGLVAGLGELVLDDLADGGIGASSHQGGDGVHGDGGHKDEEGSGGDAGLGQGDDDPGKGADRAGAEVVSRLDEGVIQFFHAGVDRKDHKRQVVVNQAQNDGERRVHHGERLGENSGGEQEAVGQTLLAEDVDPGVGADEEAGPERNHDEGEQEMADAGGGPADGVGGGIAHDHADHGGEKGVEDGVAENGQPGGIEAADEVFQREVVDHPAEVIPFAKAGEKEQARRQGDKHAQPDDERGEEQPCLPPGRGVGRVGGGWVGESVPAQGDLLAARLDLGDDLVDGGGLLPDVAESLHPSHFLGGRIAGGVGQLLGAEERAGGAVRVVVGELVRDLFADVGTKQVVDEEVGVLRVFRRLRDGHAVDEKVGPFFRKNVLELLILVVKDGALPAPDHADVDVPVFEGGLGAVGVVDLHQWQPLFQDRFDFGEVLGGDLVDAEARLGQGPADDFPGVVQHHNPVLVGGDKDVLEAGDGGFDLVRVHDDADEAGHERHGKLVARIKGHAAEFGGEVAEVGEGGLIEGDELVVLDEDLHGVFARLDQVVLAAAGEELADQLFVRAVVLDGDLDPGLLGEVIDDSLGDVLRPAEEVEFLFLGGSAGGRGRLGSAATGRPEEREDEEDEVTDGFHGLGSFRVLFETLARKHKDDGEDDSQRGQGIQLGVQTHPDHAVDLEGKGLGLGPGDKDGDDVVVEGKGEGQQRAGSDRGHEVRENHLGEGLPWGGAEIHRRLFERWIHALKAGLHADEHEGEGEGDVGDDDGEVAQVEIQDDEKHQQADAHEDFRHDHGHEDKSLERPVDGKAVTVEHPGAEGAEDGGEEGGGDPDHEGVAEGVEQNAVLEKSLVPFQGEAFPAEAGLGLVEGKDDEQDDGKIKKGKDEGGPTAAQPADQSGSARQVPATGPSHVSNHRCRHHPSRSHRGARKSGGVR